MIFLLHSQMHSIPKPSTVGLLLLCLMGLCPALLVAEQNSTTQSKQYDIVRIGLQPLKASLRSITSKGIEIDTANTPLISWNDILWLRPLKRTDAPKQPGAQLYFANGDLISANILSSDAEYLMARCATALQQRDQNPRTLRIPVEYLAGVVRERKMTHDQEIRCFKLLFSRQEDADLLELMNGDTLRGELMQTNAKSIELKTAVTTLSLPVEKIRLLSFNPTLRVQPKPNRTALQVRLADHSIITLYADPNIKKTGDTDQLQLRTGWGAIVQLDLNEIQDIQVFGERGQLLSDTKPVEYQQTPFIGKPIPLQINRSSVGGPLTIKNSYYSRGLGLQSLTEISYHLNQQFDFFYTRVGFDDSADGLGDVEITILQNNQPIYSAELTNQTPKPLILGPLDLSRAETLKIKISYGKRGDIMDRVNFCNPLLIRKTQYHN